MTLSLRDVAQRFFASPEKKKVKFSSDKEAYDYCRQLYNTTGGVTPQLRQAYKAYKKSVNDESRGRTRVTQNIGEAA